MKLAVLGGSSPFTAGLIETLRAHPGALPLRELVLHGRDTSRLRAITRYSRERLGNTVAVSWASELAKALDGADHVVNQIRFGGLEARREDALMAQRLGLPGDETLGPAGLRAAARMQRPLAALVGELHRRCPDAWLLNLTNPLSIAVAMLRLAGFRRVVGVCELPRVTHRLVCLILRRAPSEVTWSYSGFNHRGFLHGLSIDGRDCLIDLLGSLDPRGIGGVSREEIERLHAVPVKYFAMFVRPSTPASSVRRAEMVARVRREIAREFTSHPSRRPPSLSRRNLDWYPLGLLPVLEKLNAREPRLDILNVPAPDGLVVEARVSVNREGVERLSEPEPPPEVVRWLERFHAHERAALDAALDPTAERVEKAVVLDPLVPPHEATRVAAALTRAIAEDAAL